MKEINKEKQRKLLTEMMRSDEELGLYDVLRCLKCGRYHTKDVSFNGYCSDDCERNKDD